MVEQDAVDIAGVWVRHLCGVVSVICAFGAAYGMWRIAIDVEHVVNSVGSWVLLVGLPAAISALFFRLTQRLKRSADQREALLARWVYVAFGLAVSAVGLRCTFAILSGAVRDGTALVVVASGVGASAVVAHWCWVQFRAQGKNQQPRSPD